MLQILKKFVICVLFWEARMALRRHKPGIVAITGSVGKTTTKDFIVAILGEQYAVRGSKKSYNSEIGIPLTILGLLSGWRSEIDWLLILSRGLWRALFARIYPKILVIEAGVEGYGDMARTVTLIQPNITVLTQFAEIPVHVANFKNRQELYDEKELLVKATKKNGTLVFNADDSFQHPIVHNAHKSIHRVDFGTGEGARVRQVNRISVIENGKPVGTEAVFNINDRDETFFIPGVIGAGVVNSLAAAIAVGIVLQVPIEVMRRRVACCTTAPGRMRIIPGVHGSTIIDDSYNASPLAAIRALEEIAIFQNVKRVAVFGEMQQLGKFSEQAHTELGEITGECVDIVVTVGEKAFPIADAAVTKGAKVYRMENATVAQQVLQDIITAKSIVLFKGSQLARIEKLLAHYLDERVDVEKTLVRQEKEWK